MTASHAAGRAELSRVPPRHRGRGSAVVDLLVLAVLVVCWSLIPLPVAHVATGVLLLGVVLAHLLMYRARLWARQSSRRDPGRRQRRRVRERVLLLAATAAMAVSGLVQWAGVGDAEHWHAATSAILVLLAGRHAWSRRRLVHRGGMTLAGTPSLPAR